MGDTLRRGMEDAGYGGRFGMGGASVMQKYMNYNPSGQVQTQVRKKKTNSIKALAITYQNTRVHLF